MSESSQFDFTKFVPGFDFLKQLSQSNPALPQSHQWIAPTVDPQEIEKRIQELKTVHFWLEQNTRAVLATVQALEVQLMTINTLKGMNMSMSEMAKGLHIKPQGQEKSSDAPSETKKAAKKDYFSQKSSEQATEQVASSPDKTEETQAQDSVSKGQATQAVDPMAWWGALSQQFSQIANQTFAEIQKNAVAAKSATAQSNGSASPASSSARVKEKEKVSPSAPAGRNTKAKTNTKSTASKASKKAPPKAPHKAAKKGVTAKSATKKALVPPAKKSAPSAVRAKNAPQKKSSGSPDFVSAAKSWFSSPPALTPKVSGHKKGA